MQFMSKDGKRVSVDLNPDTQAGSIRILTSAGWTPIAGAVAPFVAAERMTFERLPQPLDQPLDATRSTESNESSQLDPIDSDGPSVAENGAESVQEQAALDMPIAEALDRGVAPSGAPIEPSQPARPASRSQIVNASEKEDKPSRRRRQ